uniref:Minor capsid protein n=1 Tax=Gokushovirinae environmental samples TaxID=1478972 RepID=A0A2R3UAB8_9VIRU|nr:minor capsid protein [Gokushovirinae environmental samples]
MSKKPEKFDPFRDPDDPSVVAFHDFRKTNGTLSMEHAFHTEGPSLTRQEFMAECDINTIMAQYDGYLSDPMRTVREPMFVDFTSMPDSLMGAMSILNEAAAAFQRLPAVVRREFDNDPTQWADFAADPANVARMREWGLAAPEKVPDAPMRVEVVNPPAPPEPDPKAS